MSTKIVLAQEAQQLSHGGIFGIRLVSYALVVVNGKSTGYLYRVGTLEIFVGCLESKVKPANDQLRGVVDYTFNISVGQGLSPSLFGRLIVGLRVTVTWVNQIHILIVSLSMLSVSQLHSTQPTKIGKRSMCRDSEIAPTGGEF